MAKSLHEYTIDELLMEVRRRTDQVPSNAAQPDCGCAIGYKYGFYSLSGCLRTVGRGFEVTGVGNKAMAFTGGNEDVPVGEMAFVTRQGLEDLINRACRNDVIKAGMPKTLSRLTNWIRDLYPELYISSRQASNCDVSWT